MALLERESAWASLTEYVADARRGHGRLVLINGEAGVGKSALVEQLWQSLSDARRSWGACDGLFTPRPLGPLLDIADDLGGELLELCRNHAPRDELFDALLRQLRDPDQLDLVVIEDVHWADEATIDLVRFLGRRVRAAKVLLAVTYRDVDPRASDPLRLALGELATHGPTRRIGLAPFSAQAVRRLAEGSGLEPAELYRLTGGNPFYVTEVLRAGTGAVPESARDAILARVAGLSGQARGVVEAMALVGIRTSEKLLAAVAPCPPATLEEIVHSGLVAEESSWLAYRHEIARMAVEATIPPHRRRSIHQRILDALLGAGSDDDAAMAFHAEQAGDDAATLRHASRAAQHAAQLGSHREAASQYGRALRVAAGADRATVAALHHGRATQLSLLDLWQEAAEEYERALQLWRALADPRREGQVLRELSRAMWRLCRGADSVATGEAAVQVLEPLGPSDELAWAYANLASIRCFHGDPAGAITLARSTQEMAVALGLTDVLSEALNTEACTAVTAGLSWREPMERALDVALVGGHAAAAGRAYANLYCVLADERRFPEAERYFQDGTRYCDDHDMATFSLCLRGRRATALVQTGQWDEAAELSAELLGQPTSPVNRINPWTALGLVRARRDESDAWEYLDSATNAAESTGEGEWIVPVRLARAEAHWLAGARDAAIHEIELAGARWADADAWQRGEIATWRRRLAMPTPEEAASGEGRMAPPYEWQLRGEGERAAQSFVDLGSPYEAALALLDADEEEPLRRALGILTELGAPATARLVRQRLRRLGVRSVPRGAQAATRAHPLGLTRREREVLDLICEGCSNAEIATRLVLSVKTVDHHVSAVLAKLGAPTRQAAARLAARLVAERAQIG